MTETVIKYTRIDRNQAKIANAATVLVSLIDQWLKSSPTGKIEIAFELNATQGGLGEIAIKRGEKWKV